MPLETGLRNDLAPNPTGFLAHDPEKSDEAHLSTIEPGPQAAPRLPRAHGNQSWPQDPERTARTGPEKAERLIASDLVDGNRRGQPTAVLSFLGIGK